MNETKFRSTFYILGYFIVNERRKKKNFLEKKMGSSTHAILISFFFLTSELSDRISEFILQNMFT